MVSDRDIWASANLYIKQHGEEAASRAEFMALGFEAMGDEAGRETWYRIIDAIRWLQNPEGRHPFKVEH